MAGQPLADRMVEKARRAGSSKERYGMEGGEGRGLVKQAAGTRVVCV